jgi:hypothetical protein
MMDFAKYKSDVLALRAPAVIHAKIQVAACRKEYTKYLLCEI